jgi:hypothetical protein
LEEGKIHRALADVMVRSKSGTMSNISPTRSSSPAVHRMRRYRKERYVDFPFSVHRRYIVGGV